MNFKNDKLNLAWAICFFGGLWIGFGFIIPILLILGGEPKPLAIIAAVLFMLLGHILTYLFIKEKKKNE